MAVCDGEDVLTLLCDFYVYGSAQSATHKHIKWDLSANEDLRRQEVVSKPAAAMLPHSQTGTGAYTVLCMQAGVSTYSITILSTYSITILSTYSITILSTYSVTILSTCSITQI